MLAKLSPPRLYQPVPRERLFRLLDRREQHPLVWVSGPPGAGKSTLVASYLERREIGSAWIQLDAGDKDPATLFFYLRELAGRTNPEQTAALPVFTADYAADVAGFARRYFRKWFDVMGDAAVWVLDNGHEAAGVEFETILRAAVEELPHGKCIMVLSRSEIPALLARLRVMNLVSAVTWGDLRFSAEESVQLASVHGVDAASAVAAMAERVDGWAAGLAAMIASIGGGQRPSARARDGDSRELLFDFFAGEVFDRLPENDRTFLLRTALLPHMTVAMSKQLCGIDNARDVLERLYRNQYFTTRHAESEPTYQYHALFREFLLERLEGDCSQPVLTELRRRAGQVLAENGQAEHAVDVFLDAADWRAAALLIGQNAESIVSHGRAAVLLSWTSRFPAQYLVDDAWLGYWRGVALLGADAKAAERCLARAHAGFVASDDARGRLLAAQSAIWAIVFQLGSYAPADRWLAEMQHLLSEQLSGKDPQDDITSWYLFLPLATVRQPHNALIPTAASRLRSRLADAALSEEQRLQAGTALLAYAWAAADASLCQQTLMPMSALAQSESLSPVTRCDYLCNAEGWYWFAVGNYEEAIKSFQRAEGIAREYKLFPFELTARAFAVVLAALAKRYELVDQELDALSAITGFEQFLATRMLCKARALSYWQRGRIDEAYRLVGATIEGLDACGLIDGCASVRFDMAAICVDAKDFERARQLIEEARQMLAGSVLRFPEAHAYGVEAYLALREQRHDDALEALRFALPLLKNPGTRGQFFVLAHCVPILFNEALEASIETDLVKQLIREFNIIAPENASHHWPWPVAIRALGGFEVEIDGVPLSFAGRVHYRVLQLLKAIVAFGGVNVAAEKVADALWPDADGDAAANSLRTTLHRLRRLLGREDAILQRDGKLSLNPAVCALDLHTLQALLGRLQCEPSQALDEVVCVRLLNLYRGPLLDSEAEDWMVRPRQQVHADYLSLLRELGQRLEAQTRPEIAARVYEKAVALEPAADVLRVRLAQCLTRLCSNGQARSNAPPSDLRVTSSPLD
jgi:ATP/maltotriose-dependent transcriptional regulator MalT/DNA-binding SARP family transcriptional activator